MKEEFAGQMLRVHFGEDDKWQGKPLHEAILGKCRELEIAEAVVFRGIEGYGSASRVRHSSMWRMSKDAPIQMTIIDTAEQIAKLMPLLDEMVEEGVVASSVVEVVRFRKDRE